MHDIIRVRVHIRVAMESFRIVRRIYHRSNIIEIWKSALQDLSDVEVILVRRGHAEQVGGKNGTGRFELRVQVLEEFFERDLLPFSCAPREINILHVAVRRKTNVVEIQFVKTE